MNNKKGGLERTTVLIADDNPQLLNILKASAQKEGYDVLLAQDGEKALELFYNKSSQIILLDVMMPKPFLP